MRKLILVFLLILTVFSFAGKTIDVSFYDTPLNEAIKQIEYGTGSIIIVGPEVKGKVTLSVRSLSIESALELILYGTSYDYEKISEEIYVVGSLESNTNISVYLNQPNIVKLKYITTDNIKDILNHFGARAKYIEGADFVIVYGKDFLARKIMDTIDKLDTLGNDYIFIYNVYKLTQSSYQAIQQLNYYDFPIKFDNALMFIKKNFTRLTSMSQTGFIETTDYAKATVDLELDKIISSVKVDGSQYSVNTEVLSNDSTATSQNFSAVQNIGSTIYGAYNINGYFYLITYDLLPKFKTSMTKPVGTYIKVSGGVVYDQNLYVLAGLNLQGKDIKFNYDFNSKDFKFLFNTSIVSDIEGSLELKIKDNNKLYTNISISEKEAFSPFYMKGNVYINSLVEYVNDDFKPSFSKVGYNLALFYNFLTDNILDIGLDFDLNYQIDNGFKINPGIILLSEVKFDKFKLNSKFTINNDLYYYIHSYITYEF